MIDSESAFIFRHRVEFETVLERRSQVERGQIQLAEMSILSKIAKAKTGLGCWAYVRKSMWHNV
jgi:hypothetical protein